MKKRTVEKKIIIFFQIQQIQSKEKQKNNQNNNNELMKINIVFKLKISKKINKKCIDFSVDKRKIKNTLLIRISIAIIV